MDKRTAAALEFCKEVNQLIIRGLQATSAADIECQGKFLAVQNKVKLVTAYGPTHLIDKLGPILHKYSPQIKIRDEEFFMNLALKPPKTFSPESAELFMSFGSMIRDMYRRSTQREKDDVYTTVKKLLVIHLQYLLASK